MLGRKQEINLQVTELVDSGLLAFAVWLSHFLREQVLQPLFPDLEIVAPFSELFWVMAVIVPFTPIVLEARGFYNNILNKTRRPSLRQMFEAVVGIGMIVGAFVVFFRWQVTSRSVVLIAVPMAAVLLMARESWQRRFIRRKLASEGSSRERVLLAGIPADTERLLAGMADEPRGEIEVVGHIDITTPPPEDLPLQPGDVFAVCGTRDQLRTIENACEGPK